MQMRKSKVNTLKELKKKDYTIKMLGFSQVYRFISLSTITEERTNV